MKLESEKQDDGSLLQHDAEHERPHKNLSVMSYLALLFAAALLLMMLSYLMQLRNSEEVISGLKDSVSAMQSIENLQTENQDLQQQVDDLTAQLAGLQADSGGSKSSTDALNAEIENQAKQLEAMDYFWRIQREYYRGNDNRALAYLADFQDAGLEPFLPTTKPDNVEGLAPAEQYVNLVDALR